MKCKIQKAMFLLAAGQDHKKKCVKSQETEMLENTIGVFLYLNFATYSKASDIF